MINSKQDHSGLDNGLNTPWLSFGVFQITEGNDVKAAVKYAIEVGYVQVVLQWTLQHEVVTIPKPVTASQILEHAQLFDLNFPRKT